MLEAPGVVDAPGTRGGEAGVPCLGCLLVGGAVFLLFGVPSPIKVKKSQQNRAPACGSRRLRAPNLMGTGILPEKLMACPEFRFPPSDFLSFSIEIAQGHFVSPARGTDLGAQKEPR